MVLFKGITVPVQAEERFKQQYQVLEGINRIYRSALECRMEEELIQICLAVAEEVTGSTSALSGEVNAAGRLDHVYISSSGWAACALGVRAELGRLPTGLKMRGIYERVLLDGKPILTNDLASRPVSRGIPKGHPPIRAFLGVPLLEQGRTVGLLSVANRAGGYREADLSALEAVSESMVRVLQRWRADQRLTGDLAAMTRLHSISMRHDDRLDTLLEAILDAALAITGADKGFVQLCEPDTGALRLVAHRGFNRSGLDRFSAAYSSRSACGEAICQKERVIVADVAAGTDWCDSAVREAALAAGINAYQSTPLIGRSGRLVGLISTHWRAPCTPDGHLLRRVDLLARQAADLIEQKRSEEALQASRRRCRTLAAKFRLANRRKEKFLGTLSHEMRNPLASIMLCLSMLDRVTPGGEQHQRTREIMGRQAAQLSRLVDDLLDVTRIIRNKMVLHKGQVELNELVRRIVEDYQAQFQEKEVALSVELTPATLCVEADPARLFQVVGNLLHNAAKFTGGGGYTRVTLTRDEARQRAVLRVEDSGIGMSPETVSSLFQAFTPAGSSPECAGSGLGLGLALVKGLVEMHGGTVSAHSDGPGKGSLFTVYLPLVAAPRSAGTVEAGSNVPHRSRRVLVIEDSRDAAEALRSGVNQPR